MTNKTSPAFLSFLVLLFVPLLAKANSGDFSGAVAIGTSYAGIVTAPTDGLAVKGVVGIGTATPQGILQSFSLTGDNSTYVTSKSGGAFLNIDGTNAYIAVQAFRNGSPIYATGQTGNSNDYRIMVGGFNSGTNDIAIFTTNNVSFVNSSGTCTHTPSASSETVSCSSDMRLKNNIRDADPSLQLLDSLHVRDFTIKATGEEQVGVVAQEVKVAFPEMVHQNEDGFYSVDEPNPWKLVKAIQELHDLVIQQQKEIDELKKTASFVK